jgi:hypothetical protein
MRSVAAIAMLAMGCARRPTTVVCAAPGTCGVGKICAAGRCVQPAVDPVPSDADRIVVAASDMAVVSSGESSAFPQEIALARAPVVLLRFPAPWGNRARIAAAFLTLDVGDASSADGRPLAFTVARVLEPWSPSGVSWGRLPRLSAPLATTEVTPPHRSLRIDVTAVVARWALRESDEQGIALWASSTGATSPTYATGVLGAPGPRLDVYVR